MEGKKKNQFGKYIRHRRAYCNMTREQLAKYSTLSTKFIGEIERGEKSPSLDSFIKLAIGLDMGPVSMFREITDEIYPDLEKKVKEQRAIYKLSKAQK